MSAFKWRNGFAVGLTTGFLSAIVFLLFGEKLYELAQCVAQSEYCENAKSYKQNDEPQWWYWTRRLLQVEDTLAQWVMAFFTIAVVVLVWRTLKATQEMSIDQKRIGRAQVRAYLRPVKLQLAWSEVGGANAVIIIENIGASPTRGVAASGVLKNKGVDAMRSEGAVSTNVAMGSGAEILPSGDAKIYVNWHISGHEAFLRRHHLRWYRLSRRNRNFMNRRFWRYSMWALPLS